MVMKYSVSGDMKLGSEKRKFVKTVEAKSENAAREKIYSLIGSLNGLQRSMITIKEVKEVK
jgi:ribosomal protein L20A (L18A)